MESRGGQKRMKREKSESGEAGENRNKARTRDETKKRKKDT